MVELSIDKDFKKEKEAYTYEVNLCAEDVMNHYDCDEDTAKKLLHRTFYFLDLHKYFWSKFEDEAEREGVKWR